MTLGNHENLYNSINNDDDDIYNKKNLEEKTKGNQSLNKDDDLNNWGLKKKDFYGGLNTQNDSEMNEEEKEAKSLQLLKLKHQSFKDNNMMEYIQRQNSSKKKKINKIDYRKNIYNYTTSEKLKILKFESPEVFGLIKELKLMKKKLLKMLNIYSNSKLEFQRWHSQIIIHYILNLIFYFLLKSRQEVTREHLVFDNILSLKKILKNIKSNTNTKNQIKKIISKENFNILKKNQNLEENMKNTLSKKNKINIYENDSQKDMEHRKISQMILKNRGLVRYRKNQISRVKLKKKYYKAQVSRKKQLKKNYGSLMYRGEKNINSLFVNSRQFN